MDRYPATDTTVLPKQHLCHIQYGGAFLEIHLDERFNVGEDFELAYTPRDKNGNIIIDANKRLFHDPDQCVDFISSYSWRKIFLILTDKFSVMLPLIHDLPQIVYIYIYSKIPHQINFNTDNYPKLHAIVHEDSPNSNHQLLADIRLFQRDLLLVNVNKPNIRETLLFTKDPSNADDRSIIHVQEEEENDLSVIWIKDDDNLIDISSVKNRIKSIKIYVNTEECIHYIQSLNDTIQIFLISSKSHNDILLRTTIINCKKIRFIYLFQTEENRSSPSKELSPKIRGIYSNIDDLCDHLLRDYVRFSKMSVSIFNKDKKEKTVRNLQKDNAQFLWLQLLIDILIQIPHNHQTIDEMLEECETYAKKDAPTKNYIAELRQTYRSTEALSYYTKDSFLYRRFNEAFRTENIDFIFVFRFFLTDMHNQLRQLYTEQFLNNTTDINSSLELFRGQFMPMDEFNIIKESVGHLISVNSFISTTTVYGVASFFGGFGVPEKPPGLISVLFQIDIDDTIHSLKRPFASLKKISHMKDEEEILFSIGTIFRVEDVIVHPTSNDDWYVTLKLINDDDDNEISEFRKELEEEFCEDCDLSSLGTALIKMGDYNKAERYFQMILEHMSSNHRTIPNVYNCLGIIYHNKGDYRKSLEYHQQALGYLTERNPFYEHEDNIGLTYTHIGSNYHQLGENKLALDYFMKAIQIQELPRRNAYTFNQIAMIHRENGDYKQALEYFQKALNIDENILKLHKYNPTLATDYNNLGEIYIKLGDYDNALKTLEQALNIRLKGTVSTHTDLAAIYNNLGNVYIRIHSLDKALEMFEKALEIDTKALPENHPSLAVSHNNIATLYCKKGDFIKALYHQETAVRIMLKSDAKSNAGQLASYQYNLGSIQFELGNNTKAMTMLEKALEIQLEYLSKDHENLSNTYVALSCVYEKEGEIEKALEYAEKSLENARISLLPHNWAKFNRLQARIDLFKAQHSSKNKKMDKFIYIQADTFKYPNELDEYVDRCQEDLKEVPLDDIVDRITSLNNLGTAYSRKTDYQMAMKCFEDAISLYNQRCSLTSIEEQELDECLTPVYFNLTRLYYRQNNWTKAFEILEKTLDLASKQDQEIPELYNLAGVIFGRKGDLSKAEYYFNLAIDIAKKCLPNNHPDLQRYYLQLKQIKSLI